MSEICTHEDNNLPTEHDVEPHGHGEGCDDPEVVEFLKTIKTDELCRIAESLRPGQSCHLGERIVGGFNVIFELIFTDKVSWMVRIPIPTNCFEPEDCTLTYASTLKYLKQHSRLPVPQVFGYDLKSNPQNPANVTYIFMERLSGRQCPTFDSIELDDPPEDVAAALKIHEQMTDIILELASLTFESIGTLREDSQGNFFVGPYIDSTTAYPEARAAAYRTMDVKDHGPFSTITQFYDAISRLNIKFAESDPEEEDRENTVIEYKMMRNMAPKFVIEAFDRGPFVINHSDLTIQNILVDDEFNVTGIIDFPGTIVPLPSLCVYPWMFSDNISGLVPDREAYLKVFLDRTSEHPSQLASKDVRRELMESAKNRGDFELGLLGIYTSLVIPRLYEHVYGKPYESGGDHGDHGIPGVEPPPVDEAQAANSLTEEMDVEEPQVQ